MQTKEISAQWTCKTGVQHGGVLLCEKNGYKVIKCDTCGFNHAIPIPDEKTLNAFYTSEYYSKAKPNYAEQHSCDRQWWDLVYQERYRRFEQLLGRRGKILDVGSGPGFFLAAGAEIGWDVCGVEPSEVASSYASNLGVKSITGSFNEDLVRDLEKFDVVQINQAIEHIPNPAKIIELCWQVLSEDGLICIIAANDFNPLQLIAKELHDIPDWWVIPPEHLNYFDLVTLTSLVERSNFRVIHKTATFPIDLFLLMGENYVGDSKLGKICHERRKKLEFAMFNRRHINLKETLYRSLAELGLGREIEVIARRTK